MKMKNLYVFAMAAKERLPKSEGLAAFDTQHATSVPRPRRAGERWPGEAGTEKEHDVCDEG